MDDITKTQRSFAIKAEQNQQHRFNDLYHLICRRDWITYALGAVLDNTGSRTAGIDGVSKKQLADEETRQWFIEELQAELKTGHFKPSPVRRQYIPKAGGKLRPLGIPTIKDRVVQMLMKMLLEPIWESDFLKCSHGFRPGHRTMDCIGPLYGLMNPKVKCYWVVEGDIKGCFDHIQQATLLKLIERRVADRRIVGLIRAFLQAGVMEGELFKKTKEGTPQGGVISPLLANIYLTELDRYWREHYGGMSESQKRQRRKAGLGNPQLLRYADDFIIVTNGPRKEAYRLREEVRNFLAETLGLELSLEKTAVTHVNEGFDFLGFHIRRYLHPWGGKPIVLVTPSEKNLERLKTKVREMTSRRWLTNSDLSEIAALNRVLRGWIEYYRHVNAKAVAGRLDYWVEKRLASWLCEKHRCGVRQVLRRYRHLQEGRKKFAVKNEHGQPIFLYRMEDLPLRPYRLQRRGNPYLEGAITTLAAMETPNANNDGQGRDYGIWWQERRSLVLERDGYRCQNPECGAQDNLEVHHKRWQKDGGSNGLANLVTLCAVCHKLEQQGRLTVNW